MARQKVGNNAHPRIGWKNYKVEGLDWHPIQPSIHRDLPPNQQRSHPSSAISFERKESQLFIFFALGLEACQTDRLAASAQQQGLPVYSPLS